MTYTLPNVYFLQIGVGMMALWLASWIVAAGWTRRTAAKAPGSSFRLQLAAAGLGFACLFGEPPRAMHPLWLVPPWLGYALLGLVGAGIVVAWWARIHLGPLWSGSVVTREGHRIVESGPYALVRHPIYTGLIVCGLALAVIKATPLSLIGAVLIALGFWAKARVEERFLAVALGEADYAAYRTRVPMLVPLLRVPG